MLLSFTGSRELAMQFNQPFTLKIKFDMPQFQKGTCTYADLIFVSIYKLVHSGPRLLKPIYKSIIAIIILKNIPQYQNQYNFYKSAYLPEYLVLSFLKSKYGKA